GTPGTYAISFSLIENPISDGGKWVNGQAVGLDWNNVQTVPGKAYAGMLSGITNRYDDSIAHLSTSFIAFPPNQYAQGTVYRAPGYDPSPSLHEVELHLRFQTTPDNARGYEVLWGITGYIAVVRWDGPPGIFTTLSQNTGLLQTPDSLTGPPVDGDVLRAEIRGNAITIYKNGSQVVKIDDVSFEGSFSVWTDGQPGMGFWPVDDSTPEN